MFLVLPPNDVAAESGSAPTWHLFGGLDGSPGSLFGHKGFLWSPWDDLHTPGWRLRGMAGGGGYRYQTRRLKVSGSSASVEIMPGRAWWLDGRGFAVYAGPTIEYHHTQPHDPEKPGQGTRLGAKLLLESWARLSERLIVEASGSYATAGRSYHVRVAAGIELRDGVTLEPEVAAFGEPGYDQLRVGLFAQVYGTPRLRVLAGGGWAFDRDGGGPYLGLRVKSWHRAGWP